MTSSERDQSSRIAGAPISWGVCEVPGWGYQLGPDHVLGQMAALGLAATEFGPDGFLPDAPQDKRRLLQAHGLRAVGAFVPAVLHDPTHDPGPPLQPSIDALAAAGAEVLVLAAASGADGYDARPELDALGWSTLLGALDRLSAQAARHGIRLTLHPHVGTMIETRDDLDRVLDGSEVPLCLDTGHLLIGGTDPLALARQVPRRVTHVHLKDVDPAMAARVRSGELGYSQAVRAGMYTPLGRGGVDVAGIVEALESAGYRGWYVLEQDKVLDGPPRPGADPVDDVRACLRFLDALGLSAPAG